MFLRLGGAFVMSDDSHGIDQIGTNYARLLTFIKKAGIEEIQFVDAAGVRSDNRFPSAGFSSIATSKLADLPFWNNGQ
jgi:histidinol-phosphatase (PHP family)